MEIIIVRHAEPNYAIDSLTEKGWREAELLSNRISKWDVKDFYVSPLGRAKDTAKATLAKMNREAQTLDWLQEFRGEVDYQHTSGGNRCWDLRPSDWTKEPGLYDKEDWIHVPLMQTRNVPEEYTWVTTELDKLLAKHGYVHEGNHFKVMNSNHDRIVLFSHYGVSCVLLAHILGISPVMFWQAFVMQPSSVTSLITEEREEGMAIFRLRMYGDISHLEMGNEEPSFMARYCECFEDDTRH